MVVYIAFNARNTMDSHGCLQLQIHMRFIYTEDGNNMIVTSIDDMTRWFFRLLEVYIHHVPFEFRKLDVFSPTVILMHAKADLHFWL